MPSLKNSLFSFALVGLALSCCFLSPVNAQATFTLADVALHNTQTDCWTVISNNVYVATNYINKHPGGTTQIINNCGLDATTAFNNFGNHQAGKIAANMVLQGTLVAATPTTLPPTTAKATTLPATTVPPTTPKPTTVPPTTATPTTVKPTTAATVPTTAAATTVKPTTAATVPTTAATIPTTVKPTTAAVVPTTAKPTTATGASLTIQVNLQQAYAPQCNNGKWTIFFAGYTVATTVTNNGMTNTAQPMDENGAPNTLINAAWFVGGRAAPVTVSNPTNVANSVQSANVWSFNLQNDQPNIGARIDLTVAPLCTQGQAAPAITTAFSSTKPVVVPGGNGVPPIPNGVVPTIINNLPAANNGGTGQPAVPTTLAPTKTPTTAAAAPTTAAAVPTTAAATTAAAAGAPGVCFLTVPAQPLTAAGLATPYTVTGNGCTQTLGGATFVQGAILNLDTGAISAYNPLVILAGTTPAIPPVVPTLPANYVAALWFGTNMAQTILVGTTDPATGISSLQEGACVNGGGAPFSVFGQFAACNGPAFFTAAKSLIAAKKLVIPPLGTDFAGNACPSTRDFGIVDQDQSDNTPTTYLSLANGQTAQNTPANQATLTKQKQAFTVIDNGSDEKLITLVNNAILCKGWMVPDLADTTGATMVTTLATNELQAQLTTVPQAFIPGGDPMVVDGNGNPNVAKLNAYRTSVGQAPVTSVAQASTLTYCQNMFAVGAARILLWMPNIINAPAPDFAAALSPTLAGVLSLRFNAAVGTGGLNCKALMAAAAPTAAALPNTVTAVALVDTPLSMITYDDAGNVILPASMNADGTFPQGYTWEQVMGVPEQVAALSPDNTNTNADATNNNANTNTNGDNTVANPLYIGVGVAVGFVVAVVIAVIIFKVLSNRTEKRNVNNTQMAMANAV